MTLSPERDTITDKWRYNMQKKLSELLETLEEKFPEDEDVLAAVQQFDIEFGEDEESEDELDLDAELGLGMDEEPSDTPVDLDLMMEEDLAEDDEEDEFDLDMPAKKK